jgi:DNA-directed RNA polymerase specialized sigma24 family protein
MAAILAPNTARHWTADEDHKLRRWVGERMSTREIAGRLNRTKAAIDNRRYKIGATVFKRRPDAHRVAVAAVIAGNPGVMSEEGAGLVGVSRATFDRHRRALGNVGPTRGECNRATAQRRAEHYARLRRERPNLVTGPGQKRLLAALADGPASVPDLMARLGLHKRNAYTQLYALQRYGQAFPEGRRGSKPGGGKWEHGRPGCAWRSLAWWIEHNQGVLWAAARKVAAGFRADPADLVGAGQLALPDLARRMRARGVPFWGFACGPVKLAMIAAARNENRRGVYVPRNLLFTDAAPAVGSFALPSGDSHDPEDLRAGGVASDFWQRVAAALPPRLAAVLLATARDGREQTDVGAELGISAARVSQLKDEALAVLRRSAAFADFAGAERESA